MKSSLRHLVLILLGVCLAVGYSYLSPRFSRIPPPTLSPPNPTLHSTEVKQADVTDDTKLIDIRSINLNIVLDIRYATKNNFTYKQLYPKARCLLRAEVAQQLSNVQWDLEHQGLGLKVYDCYRPLSIQKQMWKVVPDNRYVANPAQGSRHNRGSAVDITLVDRSGRELLMPTRFDDFSEQAHIDYQGISLQAKENRQRLEVAMKKQGFIPLETEWWHFDAKNWKKFPVLDVSLNAVPEKF